MTATVQLIMAGVLFLVGIVMIGSGLFIILAKEYQETLSTLSAQASKLTGKAVTENAVMAVLDGTPVARSDHQTDSDCRWRGSIFMYPGAGHLRYCILHGDVRNVTLDHLRPPS